MKKAYIILIFALFSFASAQVSFVFLPEVNARTIDGLGVFQIQNMSGQVLKGNVSIMARENINKIEVVSIKIADIQVNPGIFNFPKVNFVNSRFVFAANTYAVIASQTRNFPPGEYSFCYKFIPTDQHNNNEYEDCFESSVQPLVPVALLNPEDKDSICVKRPLLSWQPPVPFNTSIRFRLLLAEKKRGESVENLLTNSPLVLLDNITSTMINYPAGSQDLKEGKTYCWQVIAYQQGVILCRSEIWEFTIKCREADVAKPTDSYRELKFLVNGNYYIADRFLKFSFRNNYNIRKLAYAIVDISNGFRLLKNIPAVEIKQGLNNIDIDLTESGLQPGKQYLLKVYPFNEQEIEVRFVYQENSF